MFTLALYGFLAVVAVGALYGLALWVLPRTEQMSPPAPDLAPWSLSESPLQAQDVVDARLPVAVRGYRFAETDLLLDRLTEELRLRDEEISRLRGHSTPAWQTTAALPEPDPTLEQSLAQDQAAADDGFTAARHYGTSAEYGPPLDHDG